MGRFQFKLVIYIFVTAAHRIMNNNDEIIVNAKEILDKLSHSKDIPCIIELCEQTESSEKIG
jgi:hypothetical protein